MDTYNEQLENEVSNILTDLQVEIDRSLAQKNAANFNLHYATAAALSAHSVVQTEKEKEVFFHTLKRNLTTQSNSCSNLLLFTNTANTCIKAIETNAAATAVSTQTLSTAIVQLAGDIASILSMVYAMDFNSAISRDTEVLNQYMLEIAEDAELTSQLAMEASVLAAQIPSNALIESVQFVDKVITPLLIQVEADYSDNRKSVEAAEIIFRSAENNQEKADGNRANNTVLYNATLGAYTKTNQQLNLGLKVCLAHAGETKIYITFDPIKPPFERADKKIGRQQVRVYNIFVVKETNKTIFTTSVATSIFLNDQFKDRFVSIKDVKSNTKYVKKTYDYVQINVEDGIGYSLKDTDGEEITKGVQYVAFLQAVYTEEYKKEINSYTDFLSAYTLPFSLTYLLEPAQNIKIGSASGKWPKQISFSVKETPALKRFVEYRCILLPTANNMQRNEIDFHYDLTIAIETTAANYTVGVFNTTQKKWLFSLPVSTTDVFANELKTGNFYIPVILSVFVGDMEQKHAYANVWTGYNKLPLLYIK